MPEQVAMLCVEIKAVTGGYRAQLMEKCSESVTVKEEGYGATPRTIAMHVARMIKKALEG